MSAEQSSHLVKRPQTPAPDHTPSPHRPGDAKKVCSAGMLGGTMERVSGWESGVGPGTEGTPTGHVTSDVSLSLPGPHCPHL